MFIPTTAKTIRGDHCKKGFSTLDLVDVQATTLLLLQGSDFGLWQWMYFIHYIFSTSKGKKNFFACHSVKRKTLWPAALFLWKRSRISWCNTTNKWTDDTAITFIFSYSPQVAYNMLCWDGNKLRKPDICIIVYASARSHDFRSAGDPSYAVLLKDIFGLLHFAIKNTAKKLWYNCIKDYLWRQKRLRNQWGWNNFKSKEIIRILKVLTIKHHSHWWDFAPSIWIEDYFQARHSQSTTFQNSQQIKYLAYLDLLH